MSRPKGLSSEYDFFCCQILLALLDDLDLQSTIATLNGYYPVGCIHKRTIPHSTVKHYTTKDNTPVLLYKRDNVCLNVISMNRQFGQDKQLNTRSILGVRFPHLKHPMNASQHRRQVPPVPSTSLYCILFGVTHEFIHSRDDGLDNAYS